MKLFRLVYHSRSSFDFAQGPATDQVADILAVSIVNNRKFNVTGGLIHDRDWFVQVLEGDRDSVIGTFERIATDRRHRDVAIAESTAVRARRFPDCWMTGAEWPGSRSGCFLSIVPEIGFDPRSLAGDALIDLVEAMVLQKASDRGRAWWTTRSDLTTD